MSDFYSEQQRQLQDQHQTRPLADRLEQIIVESQISAQHQGFIESRDFFFLTTVDHRGYPTCSYKGGNPGLVRVLDQQTVCFPNYDGNGMFMSLGNLSGHPKIGMLFIDFETPHRLRLHGEAFVQSEDPLLAEYPGAGTIVRVKIQEVFVNCPRYIHRMQRVEASKYVPQAGIDTPVPQWKRIDAIQDVLPPCDAALAEKLGGTITPEQYGALLANGDG
jgi:predicted pyridoxine 5'-phosphate oxidase superfamily flavin-nucleotide-binding protein